MPLPIPTKREKYQHFVHRFMTNKHAKKEFPEINQRFAVMAHTWTKYRGAMPEWKLKLLKF